MRIISISEYSKLAGVSRQTIYNRIKSGHIHTRTAHGRLFIDTEAFPPKGKQRAGRRLIKAIAV